MATKKTASMGDGQQGAGEVQGGGAAKTASARKTPSAQKGASAQKGIAASKGTAAKGTGAKRATAAKQAGGAGEGTPGTGRGRRAGAQTGPDLRSDVRAFVSARPEGWNHDEWLGFLEDLRQRGHNIEDREAIGSMLERERLGVILERVPGIGAQRVRSIADRYGNIWRLKDTSPDELAREANIPRPLAERIAESIR